MLDPQRRLLPHRETQRRTMRQASTYAHFSQSQPFYLNHAVGTPLSAYEWAIADFYGKPTVWKIDIGRWSGSIGQTIRIRATDNLLVLRVQVKIWNGTLLWEEGNAKQHQTDRSAWMYTTRKALEPAPGVWLDVTAYDLPGNMGTNFLVVK